MAMERTQTTQAILKNKVGELKQADFKNYKVTVIKTVLVFRVLNFWTMKKEVFSIHDIEATEYYMDKK